MHLRNLARRIRREWALQDLRQMLVLSRSIALIGGQPGVDAFREYAQTLLKELNEKSN